MLPVAMIQNLVAESQARANEAIAGITEGWGKRQSVAGPYLAMRYCEQALLGQKNYPSRRKPGHEIADAI